MSADAGETVARDRIERFVRRFGEPYRRLAWYAALPLILTPELLAYLRLHFLGGHGGVPWIAEADLLLCDLCRPVGHEQYALDQPVRACLVAEMRACLGLEPMREAARLLLRYVRHLGRSGAGLGPAELQAEQWSAMAYLEEHRGQAAREIAAAFAAGLTVAAPESAAIDIAAPELARLVRLTEALATNLADHRELLDYAGEIAALLRDPVALKAVGERLAESGAHARGRVVEGVAVPELAAGPDEGPVVGEAAELGPPSVPVPFRDGFRDGSGDGPAMLWLPGGTFRMGSPEGVGEDSERPAHQVALGHYAVGKYPVTVGEFRRFVAATGYRSEAELGDGAFALDNGSWGNKKDASWQNPYFGQDDRHPVVCISWNDARAYCDWLGEQTGQTYGLLTEAQWEHACRAGSDGRYCFGDNEGELGDYAWYFGNAGDGTRPVGEKRANAWGLHDLHGNVWEWCRDWYSHSYDELLGDGARRDSKSAGKDASAAAIRAYSGEQPLANDPNGPELGSDRVIRGGSWRYGAGICRSACRGRLGPSDRSNDLGFRLSRTGPWRSYPITLGGAQPPKVPEPPAPVAKPRFAPYVVFRDRLDVARKDGTKGATEAPEMVYLPGGTFQMGDAQGSNDEQPVHPVRVDAFALGRTPVTWGEYLRFCEATQKHWPEWLETGSQYHVESGKDDYYAKRGIVREALDLPVVGIAWDDARAYCAWLSERTGERYALPTEAQWEFACRAGSATRWCFGNDAAELGAYAWFDENAGGRLHPVGQKRANAWGLHDMHGNCWEWCADWYSGDYYRQLADALATTASRRERTASGGQQPASGWRRIARAFGIVASDAPADANGNRATASGAQEPASENPSGPESGSRRVIRGGSWRGDADDCRSAFRDGYEPSIRYDCLGFRLSRTV